MSENQIIYSLIAKGEKPLVEYSHHTGTFNQVCLNYLKSITPNTSKAIKVDEYCIFYINQNYITYLIMTGKSYPKETAIGCLKSIQREFESTFPGRDFNGELSYGLNENFRDKLKLKYDYFNENIDVSDDKLGELKEQLNLMKEDVIAASGLLDERGQKIEVLDSKADILSRDSYTYYRQSKRVLDVERCKKLKWKIIIGVAIVVAIYLIFSIACGFTFKCLRKNK